MGKSGKIFFGSPSEEDIASIKHIVDNLELLKIKQVIQALHIRGSAILRYDQSRRLK